MDRARTALRTLRTAALVLASGSPLAATTYVLVPDHLLADQADVIAQVEVAGSEVVVDDSGIWTRYTGRITELIRGDATSARLVFSVIGGDAPGGASLRVFGAPEFRRGEEVLLFLGRVRGGRLQVLHLLQGVFRNALGAGKAVLVRDGGEAPGVTTVRHADRFKQWLHDRTAGLERPADYLVSGSGVAQQKFQLLSRDRNFRWFDFDDGGVVRWHRHKAGQRGLKKGSAKAFKKAVRAWNRVHSGAPVQFTPAGPTGSKASFSRIDGQNTVTFRDFNRIIGSPFDCDSGGVLAIGGVLTVGSPRTWKGRSFLPILEGEVLINRGVECLFKVYPSTAIQVYVHELGHALGLGHSCFATGQPRCDGTLGDATMRAFLHAPGRSTRLGADDLHGIRQLYSSDFFAAPCHLQPGKKAFCSRCGPCGEGQGNCRNDNQCFGDLVCEDDAGARFGFQPQTNVCVAPK